MELIKVIFKAEEQIFFFSQQKMLLKQTTEISVDGEFLCDFKYLMNFTVSM